MVNKCPACGCRLSSHPRCGFCAIFFGTGHLEPAPADHVDGKPICGHCLVVHRRWPERLVEGQFRPTNESLRKCRQCGELIPEWSHHECEGMKAKKGRTHDTD